MSSKTASSDKDSLRILNLNIRSMRYKLEMLEELLSDLEYPDVLCFEETWFRTGEPSIAKLHNYDLAAAYTRAHRAGGGVAIFVRKDRGWSVSPVELLSVRELQFEAVLVNIRCEQVSLNVACIYRSPGSSDRYFTEALEDLLYKMNKSRGLKFVCADFNYNFADPDDIKAADVVHLFSCYGLLKQFIECSRVHKRSSTLIDNIFTNADSKYIKLNNVPTTMSDHDGQLLRCCLIKSIKTPDVVCSSGRCFSKSNIAYFELLLSRETWLDVYKLRDPEIIMEAFFDTFCCLFNTAFPIRAIRFNKTVGKKWVSPEIVNGGALLRDLHATLRLFPGDAILRDTYRLVKKRHQQRIIDARKRFNDQHISTAENKSRSTWEVIKGTINMCSSKSLPGSFLARDGRLLDLDKDIADEFNGYFVNSVAELCRDLDGLENVSASGRGGVDASFFLAPVDPIEIEKIISSLCTKKSSGFDGVPCNLIRSLSGYLTPILTYIINVSFSAGLFPCQLKTAYVVPIYKKGCQADMRNYRPISLLSVFSKIIERAFQIRLQSYLKKFKILVPQQFGFTKGRSTQDAVLSLCETVLQNFDSKLKTAALFFDFKKAFDVVNHSLLMRKMESYGIRGLPLQWIATYLSGRQQQVRIVREGSVSVSERLNVTCGVPQGSTLGPIFFLILINDIVFRVNNGSLTLFADDTSAVLGADSMADLSGMATACVEEMGGWCRDNGIILNVSKTQLVLFSPVHAKASSSLLVRSGCDGAGFLRQSNPVRFLGLLVDENLSWECHIRDLVNKLSVRNYAIGQLKRVAGLEAVMTYYYGCVNSLLLYGLLCWGGSVGAVRVLISQKRIVRCIYGLKPGDTCRPIFIKYGIQTVYNLYIREAVLYVRKNVHRFKKFSDINLYTTRSSNKIYVPSYSLTQVHRGPVTTAIKLYNHLPEIATSQDGLKNFKRQVRNLLRYRCYYSLDEFFAERFT